MQHPGLAAGPGALPDSAAWLPDAPVPLAGSAMLTLALGSSISAARSYFCKRVLSNAVAMTIGTLLIWLTEPHLRLAAQPLQLERLRQLTEDLLASNVLTSVYLGHLTGYGILLCRLSELHTA